MKPAEITQTVVRYFAAKPMDLQAAMPSEMYFHVAGPTANEIHRAESRFVRGTAADVLADIIEKNQFFGWYVPESADHAASSWNAKIIPIYKEGQMVSANLKIKFSGNQLVIPVEQIEPKKYLDILRTPEGFKTAASLLGVEGDLEKIASTIYL